MVQVGVMTGTETPDHHGDHRALLWEADDSVPQGRVDAIIVPTARPVFHLREAAAVAESLGCPLVTFHSQKWSSADAAAQYLGRTAIDLIAIDLPEPADLRLPDLATSQLLAKTIFKRRTDISTKRNLALLLSNMVGWERVVFLDDDIQVPDPGDLNKAAGLLDTHTAVGLRNMGYPDNSVVCHAFRATGGRQGTFIGGGAMAVEVKRNRSFFPDIYNEDWFYVLNGGKRLQSVATVGQVVQKPYDPYRTTDRARAEEFGDVLAEGSFWLLDQGKTVSDGGLTHWRDFLHSRRRFIKHVLDTVKESVTESAERARMVEALKAAQGRCALITPELCVDYMQAWVADQETWRRHFAGVLKRSKQPLEVALAALTRKGAQLSWRTNGRVSVPEYTAPPVQAAAKIAYSFRPLLPGDLQRPIPAETAALSPRYPIGTAAPALPAAGLSQESTRPQAAR
jgi:hypothetical protein